MAQSSTLTERYGAPSPAQKWGLLGLVSLIVACFLGWVFWVILHEIFETEVRSELITYEVVDEHSATARVHVNVRGFIGEPSCLVRAFAEDHTVVGEVSFAPEFGSRGYTQDIRTERLATSVELVGCVTPTQPRPR